MYSTRMSAGVKMGSENTVKRGDPTNLESTSELTHSSMEYACNTFGEIVRSGKLCEQTSHLGRVNFFRRPLVEVKNERHH